MRMLNAMAAAALLAASPAARSAAPAAQEFDACDVFTQADAEQALATAATSEPVNPKAKRPKVVAACTYNGFKDGKPVAASVQFRFARTEEEADRAFEDARLQFQTKPLLIPGGAAFWSSKTGQMNLRKGRTWITLSVGAAKPAERDMDHAKKLAEILAKKI
jgi:hypothetical protein